MVLPLRELTKLDRELSWFNMQENAFQTAKELIASHFTLQYYDVKKPVTLQVDASVHAIGGVLLQKRKLVFFTPNTFDFKERNYVKIEKKCLVNNVHE